MNITEQELKQKIDKSIEIILPSMQIRKRGNSKLYLTEYGEMTLDGVKLLIFNIFIGKVK